MDFNEIEIEDFLDGDSTELDFNLEDFDKEIIEMTDSFIKPKLYKPKNKIDYSNAKKIANEIELRKNESIHYIVSGSFVMGDFLEALLVEKNIRVKELLISTLSMSQNNIDSLEFLIKQKYIDNLTLMISNYFYSHEKKLLIPYIKETLGKYSNFDLIVIRNHTKIILFNIDNFHVIIYGSGNLRSSNSIEQMVIQENEELYNFYKKFFQESEKFSIKEK